MPSKKNRSRNVQFSVKRAPTTPRSKVVDLHNKTEFDQLVAGSDKPAIIDFWAEWCVPCKLTAPAFAAAAERYGDQVNFCKVNTEKNRAVAEAFRIRSIPTMVLMYRGEVVDLQIGATNQAAIERMALKLIGKAEKAQRQDAPDVEGAPSTGLVDRVKGWFGMSRPSAAEPGGDSPAA